MISAHIHKTLRAGQDDLRVELQTAKGSITVISGPSGAGKTTLLKLLAGLMKPNNGVIKIDGDIWLDTQKGIDLSPQVRKAGFVFQNYALFPNMTVRRHLEYVTDDEAWIQRLLSVANLDKVAGSKPDHLSGGQQQRLAIIRAMANKPKLLLMDEPFSALDQKTKAGLIADLKKLWTELQTTVIIVSHYPQELADVATNVLTIGE